MSKKLTVAGIGCGDFARNFVPLFKAHTYVEKTYVCRYLDDYHFCLGYSTYHICEFAERMEKLGAHVEPCSSKEIHKQKKERESDRDSR